MPSNDPVDANPVPMWDVFPEISLPLAPIDPARPLMRADALRMLASSSAPIPGPATVAAALRAYLGGGGVMAVTATSDPFTENSPLVAHDIMELDSSVILALDVGSYGTKKLVCRILHCACRVVYDVTKNGDVITTTAVLSDAVRHYNAIEHNPTEGVTLS